MEIKVRADFEEESQRLDVFVALNGGVSRSRAQKLIDDGLVFVDGSAEKKNCRLTGGEEVSFTLPEPARIDAEPQNIPLDIIYEDRSLIVVNKPRGMVVHPAPGNPDGTLVNALLWHCGDTLSGVGGAVRPGIVHRIDKDTSGLLVVAKTDSAHLFLASQLKDKTLGRVYDAVIVGRLRESAGRIEAPIGRSPRDRKKMAVVEGGRYAATGYSVVAEYSGYSHIKCMLETGRTHQIRVHMAYIGHPVAGDTVYGQKDKSGLCGQCLHASELHFIHPETGEKMSFSAPLPDYFKEFLSKLS